MIHGVDDYGWRATKEPYSFDYITPKVLEILDKLQVQRICDLGSGNGALVAALQKNGYDVCGVEYDAKGVSLSRKTYPGIHFYNLGVQDNPQEILDAEGQLFDAVVSTEVVEHLYSPHELPNFARKLLPSPGGGILSFLHLTMVTLKI